MARDQMEDIDGKSIGGKKGFPPALVIIFFAEKSQAAKGYPYSGKRLENGHGQALPVPPAVKNARRRLAQGISSDDAHPDDQPAKQADAAPALTRRSRQGRKPAMPVSQRPGNKEGDILREIAKLHIVPGSTILPERAYKEGRRRNNRDKPGYGSTLWKGSRSGRNPLAS